MKYITFYVGVAVENSFCNVCGGGGGGPLAPISASRSFVRLLPRLLPRLLLLLRMTEVDLINIA